MQAPDEIVTTEAVISTPEELAQLAEAKATYHSLTFEINETVDLAKITKIILENQRTLHHLAFKGQSSPYTNNLSWNQTKELAQALRGCQELRVLKFEYLGGLLGDAAKYLISSFQYLSRLKHLSLQHTHFTPQVWEEFIASLDRLSSLHTLNLDDCVYFGESDFAALNSYAQKNMSLTELNLGTSTILVQSCAALKLGNESKGEDVKNLTSLASVCGLHLLAVKIKDLDDIKAVTHIISNNQKTLRRITLTSAETDTSTANWNITKELAKAISGCQELRVLEVKKFKSVFNDAIKYLISAIQHLTNLQHLNLENTYLAPHWNLFFGSLQKLNALRTLNLDCCALLGTDDFSILGAYIGTSTSLTKVNLGISPIWMDGFCALAWGIAQSANNNLTLHWYPLIYQDSERLYCNLTLAVNWENSSTTVGMMATRLKVLEARGAWHKIECKSFDTTTNMLRELQKILVRRKNKENITKLQYIPKSEEVFELPLMMTRIASHIATLQELEINFDYAFDQYNSLYWPPIANTLFAALLKKATCLHTLKLTNFQTVLLGNNCIVLEALTSLTQLKTLELRNTYLGEAGSLCLAKVLQRSTVANLDMSNAGLVSDTCFVHLRNGLRQCLSLRTLSLGTSPMMGVWLNILIEAIERKQQRPQVVWQSSSIDEMTKTYETVCDRLWVDPHLNIDDLKTRFRNQNPNNLILQTRLLQTLNKTNVPTQGGFFEQVYGRSASERQPVCRKVKGYGATSSN